MPLTTELTARAKVESLGRVFRNELPNTRSFVRSCNRQLRQGVIIKPETTEDYPAGLVGMAVDYKLRFLLDYTDPYDLVASKTPLRLSIFSGGEAIENLSLTGIGAYPVAESFESFKDFLEENQPWINPRPSEELDRYRYALALLELFVRPGSELALNAWPERVNTYEDVLNMTKEELLSFAPEEALKDIEQISALFSRTARAELLMMGIGALNPTFSGSFAVGGADADLICGSTLIDIKTRWRGVVRTDLYQIIGYAVLDLYEEYEIHNVGLLMPRQGTLLKWNLDAICEELGDITFVEFKRKVWEYLLDFKLQDLDEERKQEIEDVLSNIEKK